MLSFPVIILGQQIDLKNYYIELKIGSNLPIQGEYLRDNWSGKYFTALNFYKHFTHYELKLGINYEVLQLSDDKIKFITPMVGFQKSIAIKRFIIAPNFELGYSFLNYTIGEGITGVDITPRKESQSGLNTVFDLKFQYLLTKKFLIGLGNSYNIIYDSFGTEGDKPDDSKVIGLYRIYASLGFMF